MGLFQDTEQVERIDIADGWVDLRRNITVGDEKAATDAAMGEITWEARNRKERRGKAKGGGDAKANFSGRAYDIALLGRMISEWSEEAPVNADNIVKLPTTTVDLLMEKLDEWNGERSEEEADPLDEPSPAPSSRHLDGSKSLAAASGPRS